MPPERAFRANVRFLLCFSFSTFTLFVLVSPLSSAIFTDRIANIRHIVLVLSGKGGVGKSTVACQLAFSLAARRMRVGLLDVDICGPSVPRMLGLVGQEVHQSSSGWSPVYVSDNLGVMSIGFMLPDQDDAIIWRGPRKNGLIKQFLTDVDWGELDYLIIDTPPGTSDEHISMVQYLKSRSVDGAVIVSTPQEVSMADVRKELNFCRKIGLDVIGVVENMSRTRIPFSDLRIFDALSSRDGNDISEEIKEALATVCPQLLSSFVELDIFPSPDRQREMEEAGDEYSQSVRGMCSRFQVPFLGSLPHDQTLLRCCEDGVGFSSLSSSSFASEPFEEIVSQIQAFCDQVEVVQQGSSAVLEEVA